MEAVVVTCIAEPAACDAAAEGASHVRALRVAPDEVMFVAAPDAADAIVRAVTRAATSVDPDALVLDATDGWAAWTLRGGATRPAFSRLSALGLPGEGFVQGDVAHVPVKVIAEPERLHLLVPAMWGGYLRERILERCGTLGITEPAR